MVRTISLSTNRLKRQWLSWALPVPGPGSPGAMESGPSPMECNPRRLETSRASLKQPGSNNASVTCHRLRDEPYSFCPGTPGCSSGRDRSMMRGMFGRGYAMYRTSRLDRLDRDGKTSRDRRDAAHDLDLLAHGCFPRLCIPRRGECHPGRFHRRRGADPVAESFQGQAKDGSLHIMQFRPTRYSPLSQPHAVCRD